MSDTDIEDPHVEAWENRQEDPAFSDGTVATPGTEYPVEPGPGPVDEEGNPVDPNAPAREPEALGRGKAADDDDDDDGFDPADYSVEEVNAYVDANPEYASEIASLEAGGKNRKGVLDHIG
jgi:hypothetical protein